VNITGCNESGQLVASERHAGGFRPPVVANGTGYVGDVGGVNPLRLDRRLGHDHRSKRDLHAPKRRHGLAAEPVTHQHDRNESGHHGNGEQQQLVSSPRRQRASVARADPRIRADPRKLVAARSRTGSVD
jgi:hypothetical protein